LRVFACMGTQETPVCNQDRRHLAGTFQPPARHQNWGYFDNI